MRWSDQKSPNRVRLLVKGAAKASGLAKEAGAELRVGLVGGSDPASVAVRRAQSVLRMDARPSYFSHAFLYTGAGDEILECRLVDADPRMPEHNGVVRSKASRYKDPVLFPNFAILTYTFLEKSLKRRDAVLQLAGTPNAARSRFDLWASVAAWQAYLFRPDREPNPLASGIPHPGAAFIRWALEAASIDSSPGADDQNDAPEHLWAAGKHFSSAYKKSDHKIEVAIHASLKDRLCQVSEPIEKIPVLP